MTEELYRDEYGALLHDPDRGVLELSWYEQTESMRDEEFMAWLDRYAGAAEDHKVRGLLVDLTSFKGQPGEQTGPWRDEHIIPRYNGAGVQRMAYLLAEGSPGTVESGGEPSPEPGARFPTGYFGTRERAESWLTE